MYVVIIHNPLRRGVWFHSKTSPKISIISRELLVYVQQARYKKDTNFEDGFSADLVFFMY